VARPVAMRASYSNDAAFLIRFRAAVEKDTRRTPQWQRETCGIIQRLQELLLLAERENLEAADKARRKAQRRGGEAAEAV